MTVVFEKTWILGALLALILAGPAAALDMVVGDVTIQNLNSFGFDAQGTEAPAAENSVLTFDSGVTDELFQMFGYLGTASGHVRIDSTNFNINTAINQVGNTAVSQLALSAAGATALGLAIGDIVVDYTFTLIDDTSAIDQDHLGWQVDLTNTSAAAIALSLYTYVDLDLNGTFGDDSAITDTSRMFVTDGGDPTHYFMWDVVEAAGADHFQVGNYPSVRTALNNMTSAQNLNDTAGVFGPADFSGAYQFDRVLAASSTETVVTLNTAQIPEPNTALLTGLGLIGLHFYGRSRRQHA
jgi:hypothetical protein